MEFRIFFGSASLLSVLLLLVFNNTCTKKFLALFYQFCNRVSVSTFYSTAKPGGCNENWPCPPRGVCIRRECHCEEHNIIGNGQTWCTVPGESRKPQSAQAQTVNRLKSFCALAAEVKI